MIDFGDGSDGAFAPAAAVALFDADGRRNAGDEVHVRTGQLLDELPRVNVHRIEETALAFGEQKIERKRAFPGTADTGDDNKFVPRNCQ